MMILTRCGRTGLLALLLLAAGCALDRPYPAKTFYVLPDVALTATARSAPPRVLHVPRAQVAPPFNQRALQYRVGEATFEPTYYDQWASDVGALLTAAVSRSITHHGAFVVLPTTAGAPAPSLSLHVTELYAEVRDARNPRAVLTVQATLLDASGGILLSQTLNATAAAASNQPADIVNAWATGLARELDALLPELVTAQLAEQIAEQGAGQGAGQGDKAAEE